MNIPKIADSPEPNREDWIARRMDTELSQPLGAQSDILDSYDPILDPSYRLVKNWSVNYDEGLRNLGIAPLTGDAWIVMNSMKSKPAFVSFWSLIPHRDPSLQLWLGTNFRLVTVTMVGSANENLKFPLEKELTVVREALKESQKRCAVAERGCARGEAAEEEAEAESRRQPPAVPPAVEDGEARPPDDDEDGWGSLFESRQRRAGQTS